MAKQRETKTQTNQNSVNYLQSFLKWFHLITFAHFQSLYVLKLKRRIIIILRCLLSYHTRPTANSCSIVHLCFGIVSINSGQFLRYGHQPLAVTLLSCTNISIVAGPQRRNKLPASVVYFRTLSSFKTSLDHIDIYALFSHVWCTF